MSQFSYLNAHLAYSDPSLAYQDLSSTNIVQHRFTSMSKLSTLVSTPDIIHDVLSPCHLACRHVADQDQSHVSVMGGRSKHGRHHLLRRKIRKPHKVINIFCGGCKNWWFTGSFWCMDFSKDLPVTHGRKITINLSTRVPTIRGVFLKLVQTTTANTCTLTTADMSL